MEKRGREGRIRERLKDYRGKEGVVGGVSRNGGIVERDVHETVERRRKECRKG